jgi:hypothetical protein
MSAIRRRSLVFISILSMASAHLSVGTAYGDISNELQGDIFKESRQVVVAIFVGGRPSVELTGSCAEFTLTCRCAAR